MGISAGHGVPLDVYEIVGRIDSVYKYSGYCQLYSSKFPPLEILEELPPVGDRLLVSIQLAAPALSDGDKHRHLFFWGKFRARNSSIDAPILVMISVY